MWIHSMAEKQSEFAARNFTKDAPEQRLWIKIKHLTISNFERQSTLCA